MTTQRIARLTGVLALTFAVSACGTSEARKLVSDMKATSASAQQFADRVEDGDKAQVAVQKQLRATIQSLYAAYVKGARLQKIDSICSAYATDIRVQYSSVVGDASAEEVEASAKLESAVNDGVRKLVENREQARETYNALAKQAAVYPGDGDLVLRTEKAKSAYAATAYVIEAIVRSNLSTGYTGINKQFQDFTVAAQAVVDKKLGEGKDACDAARDRAKKDAVKPLDLGPAPKAGNGAKLFKGYAETMGKASGALENYFNTNFSLGKGSFFEALKTGLFDGFFTGKGGTVTGKDIVSQAEGLAKDFTDGLSKTVAGFKKEGGKALEDAKKDFVSRALDKGREIIGKVADDVQKRVKPTLAGSNSN